MASRKAPRTVGLTSSTPSGSPMYSEAAGPSHQIFGNPVALMSATSPITRADQEPRLCDTIAQPNQTVFTDVGGDERKMMKPKSAQAPYPFPRPECMSQVMDVTRYENFVFTLRILQHFISVPERFGPKPEEKASGPVPVTLVRQVKKKGKGPLPTRPTKPGAKKEFKFTKEMFMSNNSEAFIQVTHFLFEILDKKEATIRFRECWPIYEKKQESLYRRAALEWFKEIILANPKWFSRSVKVEQLQGLIVNPYGDRFMKFISSFGDFVMYHVTKSGPLLATPVMDKPVYTGKAEISNRQGAVLGARIVDLTEFALDEEKTRLEEVLAGKGLERRMNNKEDEWERKLVECTRAVQKLIKKRPDLFPENADDLLANEGRFFKDAFKDIPVVHRWEAMEHVNSPLYEHVHDKLMNKIKSVGEEFDAVLDFTRRHSRFFTLVQAAYQEPLELDLATLFIPEALNNKEVDFDELLNAYGTLVDDCLQKLIEIEITDDLVERKKNLDRKIQLLKKKVEAVDAIPAEDPQKLRREVDFEIHRLEIELEDVDWSLLSGCNDPPLSSMFQFSPTRAVDASRPTGLTPALSSYLPALDFSRTVDQSSVNETKVNARKEVASTSSLSLASIPAGPPMASTSTSQFLRNDPRLASAAVGQSVCDSPVTHLAPAAPLKNRFNEITGASVPLRNAQRSNMSNPKFRLSLPVVEDEGEQSPAEKHESPVATSSAAAAHTLDDTEEDNTGFISLAEASQERINALLESLAGASAPSPEPAVKARNRRRSSQNFRRDRYSLDLSMSNHTVSEDLESKLGIMDVSISYANILDLSIEDDGDGDRVDE